MDKCGYLNKDDSCNCTTLCNEKECIAIRNNYETVYKKTLLDLEINVKILKKLEKELYG